MKNLLIAAFLFCMFFGTRAIAQCDLNSKTDDFSGAKQVWTERIKMVNQGVPKILKSITDNNCTYRIYHRLRWTTGKIYLWISEDADQCSCIIRSIEFKFESGAVLAKNNVQGGSAEKTTLGEEQHFFFELTKEELSVLANNRIVKFRIKEPNCTDHPSLEGELDAKVARKIKEASACMLQRIDSK